MELLAQLLRRDPGVHKVEDPKKSGAEMKVLAHIYNLNILCKNECLVERVLKHTQLYEASARAKLNVVKSNCLALDELKDLSTLEVSVPHEGVKILRVGFHPELTGQKAWGRQRLRSSRDWDCRTYTF